MKLSSVRNAVGRTSLLLFAFVGGVSRAQTPAPPAPPAAPATNVFYEQFGPGPIGLDDTIEFVGFEGGVAGETVTSSPFSATITAETTQVLQDGNRIQRKTTSSLARDSHGRTRREVAVPAIGPWTTANKAPHAVIINDVVAGTQYVLEPERKIARQFGPAPGGWHSGAIALPALPRLGQPGDMTAFNVEIGPNDLPAFNFQMGRDETTTTPLGTKTINGVSAQGTRTTRNIPAGRIGNEKTIAITTERWYSPDLLMFVLTKRTDPLRGDSIRQLTDIRRAEPDPSLFQVPSDYTVQKNNLRVRVERRTGRGQAPPAPAVPGAPPPPPQD